MKLKEFFPDLLEKNRSEIEKFQVKKPYDKNYIFSSMYRSVLNFNVETLDANDWYSPWRVLATAGTAAALYASKQKAILPLSLVNAYISNLTETDVDILLKALPEAIVPCGEGESFLLNLQDLSFFIAYSAPIRHILGDKLEYWETEILWASRRVSIQTRSFIDGYLEEYSIDKNARGLLPQFEW